MKPINSILKLPFLLSTLLLMGMSSRYEGCDKARTAYKIGEGVNDIATGRDTKFYRAQEQYRAYQDRGRKEGYSKGLRDARGNNSYSPRPERSQLFAGRIGDPIASQREGWDAGYSRGYREGFSNGNNRTTYSFPKRSGLSKIFSRSGKR